MNKTVGSALATIGLVALAGACTDSPLPTEPAISAEATLSRSREPNKTAAFDRYVAIGTSVSMGWRSDGITSFSQQTAWPALLARMARRELSLPLIQAPGCGAPLSAPLASGLRTNGELAAQPMETRTCADNVAGVARSTGNVAITAATTLNALTSTPETMAAEKSTYARLSARALSPDRTQVSSMLASDPEIVSVELGANELLGARTGVYLPGETVFPTHVWKTLYPKVLDAVQSTARYAVVVGLLHDALDFPSFRRAEELWDARATFSRFNVAVGEDCGGVNKNNVLFVAVRVPDAVARGAARVKSGQAGPHVLTCGNAPSSSRVQDHVLAPEEIAAINAQLAEMNAFIRDQAFARGFAHFELEVLYGRKGLKARFDAGELMTSRRPYGAYVSLDGFHPSALGAFVLARAAAEALDERYGFNLTHSRAVTIADADDRDSE